jgi:GNAT superfamily N-acetyltransferase
MDEEVVGGAGEGGGGGDGGAGGRARTIVSREGQQYELRSMRDGDLKTVLDRSPIPRTLTTLREMVSVGLYVGAGEGQGVECIGWGFLSKDGSISSLHVEPEHRGRGLAVVLARRLLGMQREMFTDATVTNDDGGREVAEEDDEGPWWGAADVEENNTPSRRVMEKLGGQVWWGVQWVEIDVLVVLEGLKNWDGSSAD